MTDSPPTLIPFTKAEANGNDFLLVAAGALPVEQRRGFTRAACDRHRGVGADGVEFIDRAAAAPRIFLYNADGSEAEISGNGTRCVAALLAERDGFREGAILTAAGPKFARVLARSGGVADVELDMGLPVFEPQLIPMNTATPLERVLDYELSAGGRRLRVTALSMGNPQCCVLVEQFPDNWVELGAALAAHAAFPQRTNVEFVRVTAPDLIELRIFERGVGPTQSSGTGSCAAAVAAILSGRARSPLAVVTPGGEQQVTWTGERVTLRGPARLIAHGEFLWHAADDAAGKRPQGSGRPLTSAERRSLETP